MSENKFPFPPGTFMCFLEDLTWWYEKFLQVTDNVIPNIHGDCFAPVFGFCSLEQHPDPPRCPDLLKRWKKSHLASPWLCVGMDWNRTSDLWNFTIITQRHLDIWGLVRHIKLSLHTWDIRVLPEESWMPSRKKAGTAPTPPMFPLVYQPGWDWFGLLLASSMCAEMQKQRSGTTWKPLRKQNQQPWTCDHHICSSGELLCAYMK